MNNEIEFKKIECPKCKHEVVIDIAHAYDETAEEWRCPNCGFIFRYANS